MKVIDPEPHDGGRLGAVIAAAPEGAHVKLGAGWYEITEPIVLARGATISGEPGRTHLVARENRLFWLTRPGTKVRLFGLSMAGAMEPPAAR